MNRFNGSIDEVRIFKRALSPEEVLQLYSSNLSKTDTNKWSFVASESNLTGGAYQYQASEINVSGVTNQTETRMLNVDIP